MGFFTFLFRNNEPDNQQKKDKLEFFEDLRKNIYFISMLVDFYFNDRKDTVFGKNSRLKCLICFFFFVKRRNHLLW